MSKHCVQAGWADTPHLTAEAIADMMSAYPEHELEARMKGTPTLGEGKIYSVPESNFVIDDFDVPAFWFRCYGLDVGYRRTAAMFAAHDRDSDIVYFYSEHYGSEEIPAFHANAIKARGEWIPGVIDPAAKGRSQVDGARLIELYAEAGLDIQPADNSVEAGIMTVRERLVAGRLKVFKSCANWLAEYRLYRRDDKGRVVKANDHAQDAGRYCIMSGLDRAKQRPAPRSSSPFSRGRVFSG